MSKKLIFIIVIVFLFIPFLARAPIAMSESEVANDFDRILWYFSHPLNTYILASDRVNIETTYLLYYWQDFAEHADDRSQNNIALPVTVGIEIALAILFISWIDPISQFEVLLFRQFKGNKLAGHQSWGLVYNSLNKLPVDLATVRLIQTASGKIIQTKVTDNKGRFVFMANPGEYILQVQKNNFIFPSQLFSKSTQDGQKANLYHGEIITISEEGGIIARNIPVDPAGNHYRPIIYWFQTISNRFRLIISWAGLLLAFVSYLYFFQLILAVLLAIQGGLFVLLRELALSSNIKRWGTVYDLTDHKPVSGVKVELFNAQFSKHTASQITDRHGRYYFIVGEGDYYLTFNHPGFVASKMGIFSFKNNSDEKITIDKGLERTLYRHPGGLSSIKKQEKSQERNKP